MNIKTIISVLRARGFRNVIFRTQYEFKRRKGLQQYEYPTSYKEKDFISLEDYRKSDNFFFRSRTELSIPKCQDAKLKETFKSIEKGCIPFFSNLWYELGNDWDWMTNPDTGYRYDANKHWTKIEDIDERAGDIKFAWEPSRFSYLCTICRYDYHFNEDHAELVISQILDWIKKNPLNCGPNYKCSQEISLRLLNWTFALNFYKNSKSLTAERLKTILNSIYWQIKHVEQNINFSRYCVRNNHAVTETLTLYLTSLFYPYFPDAPRRNRKGKAYFEEEIGFQIAADGSFIQESMNYHRVLIQLLTWSVAIANKHEEKYSGFVYDKAIKAVNFLYQCQDEQTGWLPNYGANDGALFFPLNNNDYRDYRPQLDALHTLLTGESLYGEPYEDSQWCSSCFKGSYCSPLKRLQGIVKFESSGYYVIRENDSLTLFRCGQYNHPLIGGNDSLHLDVWHKGMNILTDAGSYRYNTARENLIYFNGNEGHNTVMVDNMNFMRKGIRFIWNDYVRVKSVSVDESETEYVIEAVIDAFVYNDPVMQIHRIVRKKKDKAEWIVEDEILNKPSEAMLRQLWHSHLNEIDVISDAIANTVTGKESVYYGSFVENEQTECITKNDKIRTTIISKV